MSKLFLKSFAGLLVTVLFLILGAAGAIAAPRLYLEQSAGTVTKDSEFEIKLLIDSEQTNVFGADATVNYPASDVEFVSATTQNFFPDFAYVASGSGTIETHAYISSLYEYRTGKGTIASLKFKAKKDSGTGIFVFDCNNTQIINLDGNNIINCNSLEPISINFVSPTGGTTVINPTDAPAGEPNSCGGTCGSHYNCKPNLFCYNGFCRNPICENESSCECKDSVVSNLTVKPTLKPRLSKATVTPQASPKLVTVSTGEVSFPSIAPIQTEETNENTPNQSPVLKYLAFGLAGILLLVLVIIILAKISKRKAVPQVFHSEDVSNPPQPPVNTL